MSNFAVTGVAGYVAPRHLRAIRETGHRLVAATDPKDSVGILDQYSFDVRFFSEYERFDRYLEKLRRQGDDARVRYLTVCSPNYLHDAHCRLGLRIGADVICEKPLVINPWNLDALEELESETAHRVWTVLQLRVHPALVALRQTLEARASRHQVVLSYVTARGPWYHASWKGSEEKSGGIATNIGIHFFDLLIWMFGAVGRSRLHLREHDRMAGSLEMARADVRWFLSVNATDLPFAVQPGGPATSRSLVVDDVEVEFGEGFADLHTPLYTETLAGRGFGIDAARPSIELSSRLRTSPLEPVDDSAHPRLLTTRVATR